MRVIGRRLLLLMIGTAAGCGPSGQPEMLPPSPEDLGVDLRSASADDLATPDDAAADGALVDAPAADDLTAPITDDLALGDLAAPVTDDLTPPDLAAPARGDLATDGAAGRWDLAVPAPDLAAPDLAAPDLAPAPRDLATPDLRAPDLAPAPTCKDGEKNGRETDVDCGGGACPKCALAKSCLVAADCGSGLCRAGRCALALSFGSSIDLAVPSLFFTVTGVEVAVGDLDGDHRLDAVLATRDDDQVVPLFGHGDGTFAIGVSVAVRADPRGLAVADLNRDGRPDVAVADQFGGSVSVLLNLGGGKLASPLSTAVTRPFHLAAGDLNGDEIPDLVVGQSSGQSLAILLGKGDGTFPGNAVAVVATNPASPVLADLNGDGALDVATTADGVQGGGVAVLLGRGNGTFTQAVGYPTAAAPFETVAGDFTSDGKLDLLTWHAGSNTVALLVGDGTGRFAPAKLLQLGTGALCAADFDLDGRLDVAMDGKSGLAVFLGNGDGTFAPAVAVHLDAAPGRLAVGDFNGDGKPDLVSAGPDGFGATTVNVVLDTSK